MNFYLNFDIISRCVQKPGMAENQQTIIIGRNPYQPLQRATIHSFTQQSAVYKKGLFFLFPQI